jgi:hypothetical protein
VEGRPLSGQARAVLNFYEHRGSRGATAHEVAGALGLQLHSATPRILELRRRGLVVGASLDEDGGPALPGGMPAVEPETRDTGSGCRARVWRRRWTGEAPEVEPVPAVVASTLVVEAATAEFLAASLRWVEAEREVSGDQLADSLAVAGWREARTRALGAADRYRGALGHAEVGQRRAG